MYGMSDMAHLVSTRMQRVAVWRAVGRRSAAWLHRCCTSEAHARRLAVGVATPIPLSSALLFRTRLTARRLQISFE